MATLRPRLDIACCYVSHVEPWLNPEDVGDLWYLGGAPDSLDRLPRIFSAVPHRVIFAGHYHHWFAATEDEILDWHGEQPLQLRANRRYFLVIGALCEGRSATFETDTSLLQPFQDEFPSTDTHVPSADAVSTALDLLGREVRRPE
jgi:hypothetical protein